VTAASASPLTTAADGVRLAVRLTPKAAADRIVGLIDDGDGGCALKVAVRAPPEGGKANAALLALLARILALPRRRLTLLRGASDRRKLVHVAGDAAALLPAIAEALKPWSKPE